MDGQAGHTSEHIQREKKRSHEHFKMDQQELKEPEAESDSEERSAKRFHKGQHELLIKEKQISGNSPTEPESGEESFNPTYVVCLPQEIRGGQESTQDLLSLSCCPAEGSIHQTIPGSMLEYLVYIDHQHSMADCPVIRAKYPPGSPVTHRASPILSSPLTDSHGPVDSVNGTVGSAWSPSCLEQDPVGAAAHLHLLGESLSLIGLHLQGTNKLVGMTGSMSLLLDSLLCALPPLLCLTAEIPELRSCTQNTLASTLENIAYMMPGM